MKLPSKFLQKAVKYIFLVCVSLQIFLGGISLLSEVLIKMNRTEQAFRLFPYFSSQLSLFKKKLTNTQDHLWLERVYAYTPDIVSEGIDRTTDLHQKAEKTDFLFSIAPWQRLQKENVSLYWQVGNKQKGNESLLKSTNFFKQQFQQKYSREEMDFAKKHLLSLQIQQYLGREKELNVDETVDLLKLAYYLDEWSLSSKESDIGFLNKFDEQGILALFKGISGFSSDNLGENRSTYAEFLHNAFIHTIAKQELSSEETNDFLLQLLSINEWEKESIWRDYSTVMIDKVIEALSKNEFEKASELLTSTFKTYDVINSYPYKEVVLLEPIRDDKYEELLNLVLDLANASHWNGQNFTGFALNIFETYRPEMLDNESFWLNTFNWNEGNHEEILDVARQAVSEPTEKKSHRLYVKIFQKAANESIKNNSFDKAELYLQNMQDLLSKDYWVASQLGNFYMLTDQRQKASEAFILCQEKFDFIHDGCQHGISQTKDLSLQLDKASYWEVSHFIFFGYPNNP